MEDLCTNGVSETLTKLCERLESLGEKIAALENYGIVCNPYKLTKYVEHLDSDLLYDLSNVTNLHKLEEELQARSKIVMTFYLSKSGGGHKTVNYNTEKRILSIMCPI